MWKKCKGFVSRYAYGLLPIAALLCLAGFIGSYLFPNEVLDTYEVNMEEAEGDEEFIVPLSGAQDELGYAMETDGRALKGIQIGISKNGASLQGTTLLYRVYALPVDAEPDRLTPEEIAEVTGEQKNILLEAAYDLGSCMDGQYPYLPFEEKRLYDRERPCAGKLYITFFYQAGGSAEGITPGVFANHGAVEHAASYLNGQMLTQSPDGAQGMIKGYYIYSHDTYPLLYDCRVLTFVFLAAAMTVAYPLVGRKGKGKKTRRFLPEAQSFANQRGRGAVRHGIALVVIVLLALLSELLIFNQSALFSSYEPVCLTGEALVMETKDSLAQLSAEEQNAIEVEEENKKLLAEYNGETYERKLDESLVEQDGVLYRKVLETRIVTELPGGSRYIKKVKVEVPLEENGGASVRIYGKDVSGKTFYCSINPKLDAGVANVGESGNALEVVLLTEEDAKLSDVRITVSNDLSVSLLRVCFFAALLWTIYLLFLGGRGIWSFLRRRPEWFFALSALVLGGLLIGGIGTNQVSFDEYSHAKSAYKLSFGSTIETTEAAMQMVGNQLPFFGNPEERRLVEAYEDTMNDPDVIAPDIGHQSRFPRAETRVYYPMAAGFFLGRLLHMGFADMVALAKLGNLLCYIVLVFWAVRKAKGYQTVVALIGLLPNNLFVASAISYDALVNACLLLAYVMLLNELLTPKEKLGPGSFLLMLLAFVVGSLSKPVYIIMALMALFLPTEKFPNKRQAAVCKAAVVILAGLMIYNIFFPTPVAGGDYRLVSNAAYAGDKRSVGTSTMGQIAYIVHNPLVYTRVLLSEMLGMLADYTVKGVPYVGYAYLGYAPFAVNWIFILTGLFAALSAQTKEKLTKGVGGLTHLMNFGLTAVIFSSMYISYTAVGKDTILGVQGRYFIPLFLPFLSTLFLAGRKHVFPKLPVLFSKWEDRAFCERVVFGVPLAVNLAMIWRMVILSMNI